MSWSLTPYPGGVSSFGMPVLPGAGFIPPTTGKIWFVHYTAGIDSGGYGTSPDKPFKTIDYAIGNCTANKGDVIVVMPGHAESISGAGGIAADVAGITIVGLGWGTLRPKITLHTTITTIAVSQANVTFRNLQITIDVDAVVSIFNITAAGCTIDAVDYVDTAACAPLCFLLTSAAGDDLTIQNCKWVQTVQASASVQNWLKLIGADRIKILNNFASLSGIVAGDVAHGVIVGSGTASLDVLIAYNNFVMIGGVGMVAISMLAASTGLIVNNNVGTAKTAIAGQVAAANCFCAQNFVCNTVNKSGLLDPVVDS